MKIQNNFFGGKRGKTWLAASLGKHRLVIRAPDAHCRRTKHKNIIVISRISCINTTTSYILRCNLLCHRQHISAKPITTPAPALAPDPTHPIPHLSPALATITFSPASARLLRALLPTQLFAHKRTWIPEEKISPMCSFIGRIKGKGVSQQVWWNPHLQSHSSALGGFPEKYFFNFYHT